MSILLTPKLQRFDKTNSEVKTYALEKGENSLEEEGYHADAKYVREELISKILELIDGLNDVKHTVDEFYSSKNFYEHKLEMLLSNMF